MAEKRASLTQRTVDRLQPAAARFDVYDAAVRGFHLRVYPGGSKVYRLKYMTGGRQRVATIGEHGAPWTSETARGEAEVLRGIVKAGRDPVAEKQERQRQQAEQRRRAITVAQLIERWLEDGPEAAPNKRQSSWAHDASRLRRHIVPLLGSIQAGELRRADIDRAQRDIRDGKTAKDERTGKARGRARVRGGPQIARGAIVSLSSAYSWAVAQELVDDNPVARVKKLAATKRERFLSEAEIGGLLDSIRKMEAERKLSSEHADAYRLLILTGARKREISDLAWSEVEIPNGVIKLPPSRSKTGEKFIALNAPAAAILSERAQRRERLPVRQRSAYVFPAPTNKDMPAQGLQKAWQRVRKAAKLEGVRLHDLRHSYASFAVAGGASLALIGKALGHTQVSTTARYSHFSADPVKALAERVGHRIMSAGKASAKRKGKIGRILAKKRARRVRKAG